MKQKILITCDYFPPAVKAGGPLRTIEAWASALGQTYEVQVLTRAFDFQSAEAFSDVLLDQLNQRQNYHVYYSSQSDGQMKKWLRFYRQFLPNHLILNSFFSPRYSLFWLILAQFSKTRIHCAPRGELMPEALKIKSGKKKILLALTSWLWRRKVQFIFSSELEKQEAVSLLNLSDEQTMILPEMRNHLEKSQVSLAKKAGELKLFFLARIHPIKNLHRILEMISNTPAVHLSIFGVWTDDHGLAYWEKCQNFIKEKKMESQVSYRGFAKPEEISALILAHHALILPSSSENFGHSILETLALGRPVLISDRTPWSGVNPVGAGRAISLSDEAQYLETLQSWLQWSQTEFDQACQRARDFCESQYSGKSLETSLQAFRDKLNEK